MRALYFDGYGPPSVLKVGNVGTVMPGPGDVRIRVAGAGLNPVDAKIRSGALDGMFPIEFPVVTGWDVSGRVDRLGAGVSDTWLGADVYAYARGDQIHAGTCAQYCVVPEAFLARAPTSMPIVEAAAVPLVALTAYQAIVDQGHVSFGEHVLILAGGGAVGRYAIQLAKSAGATVTATARSSDHDALRALGADNCIEYRDADWDLQAKALAPTGFAMILDGVGADSLQKCYALVGQGGRLIGLNDPPEQSALSAPDRKAMRLFSVPNGQQLQEITRMIDAKDLRPLDVKQMALADGAAAHSLLDNGAKQKIVLTP